jgi:1-phosphofructokinase
VLALRLDHSFDVAVALGLEHPGDPGRVGVVLAQIGEDVCLRAWRRFAGTGFRVVGHGGDLRPERQACHREEPAHALRVCPDVTAARVGHGSRVVNRSETPRVAIFSPDPLLSVAIEARGPADELHVHAAGQGVWVARMLAELGASPVLCSFLGGETGILLRPLLQAVATELRVATTTGPTGSYVTDRRGGERQVIATALRPAPQRHEIDDLLGATVTAALGGAALVICDPYPADGLPDEIYATLAGDVKAAGIPVLVDLSSPRLDQTLACQPDLVKLNDWQLAEFVCGPVDGPRLLDAARALRAAGARTVAVTRAEAPILVVPSDGEPFEVVPPAFPVGHREGCGDTMMGAIAAAWVRGLSVGEALVLGAAAGSANFLRHGLGTGRRAVVEELAGQIVTRPLAGAGSSASKTAA